MPLIDRLPALKEALKAGDRQPERGVDTENWMDRVEDEKTDCLTVTGESHFYHRKKEMKTSEDVLLFSQSSLLLF